MSEPTDKEKLMAVFDEIGIEYDKGAADNYITITVDSVFPESDTSIDFNFNEYGKFLRID